MNLLESILSVFEYLITNVYFMFFLNHFLVPPILGLATTNLIVAFSRALHFSIKKMHRGKVAGLFTLFYISLSIAYKDVIPHSSVYSFYMLAIGFGFLVGALWTFIFLKLPASLGRKISKPRVYYLWFLFSSMAVACFLFRYSFC